jgi:hypothetical protein
MVDDDLEVFARLKKFFVLHGYSVRGPPMALRYAHPWRV